MYDNLAQNAITFERCAIIRKRWAEGEEGHRRQREGAARPRREGTPENRERNVSEGERARDPGAD